MWLVILRDPVGLIKHTVGEKDKMHSYTLIAVLFLFYPI